jgi:Family of unknown function (DUF5318)
VGWITGAGRREKRSSGRFRQDRWSDHGYDAEWPTARAPYLKERLDVITAPSSLLGVRTQRQVVDYALQRKALLAEVYAGRVGTLEVCDANPYLLRAAKFHGSPSDVTCPVCRKEILTRVSWVYGDALKHASGSARAPEELARMANLFEEFTVYVVEVCRTCGWNHLVQSYVLGTRGLETRKPRRRTAAE